MILRPSDLVTQFFHLGLLGQSNSELKLNSKNISTQESKCQLEIVSSGP